MPKKDLVRRIDQRLRSDGGISSNYGVSVIEYSAGPDIDVTAEVISRKGNSILLFDANGTLLQEFAATAGGLTSALAAAVSGSVILLPACNLAVSHQLTAGVTLRGISTRGTILTGMLTGSAGSAIECLSIYNSANDANSIYALRGPTTGATYVRDCVLEAVQAGAGAGYAVGVQDGDVYIYNSRAFGSTAMTDEV